MNYYHDEKVIPSSKVWEVMVGVPFRSHVRMAERSKASNPRLVVESWCQTCVGSNPTPARIFQMSRTWCRFVIGRITLAGRWYYIVLCKSLKMKLNSFETGKSRRSVVETTKNSMHWYWIVSTYTLKQLPWWRSNPKFESLENDGWSSVSFSCQDGRAV